MKLIAEEALLVISDYLPYLLFEKINILGILVLKTKGKKDNVQSKVLFLSLYYCLEHHFISFTNNK